MPGVALEIDLAQLPGLLARQAAGLARPDLRPAWRRVSLLLSAAAKETFAGAMAPDGAPWQPFRRTPPRRRGGASAKLLRDTGLLMASYTAGAGGHVEDATPTSLIWGSNLDRAGWHHFGTSRGIPARSQIGLNSKLLEKIDLVVGDWLEQMLGGG